MRGRREEEPRLRQAEGPKSRGEVLKCSGCRTPGRKRKNSPGTGRATRSAPAHSAAPEWVGEPEAWPHLLGPVTPLTACASPPGAASRLRRQREPEVVGGGGDGARARALALAVVSSRWFALARRGRGSGGGGSSGRRVRGAGREGEGRGGDGPGAATAAAGAGAGARAAALAETPAVRRVSTGE